MKISSTKKTVTFSKLLMRYSITIFVSVNAIFLIVAVLAIQRVVSESSNVDSNSVNEQLITIEASLTKKLSELYPSSEVVGPPLIPPGRINPFGEN